MTILDRDKLEELAGVGSRANGLAALASEISFFAIGLSHLEKVAEFVSLPYAALMHVWMFAGSEGMMALCPDEEGITLPACHGPWRRLRGVRLDHSDDDEEQARSLIKDYGYCCFDSTTDLE